MKLLDIINEDMDKQCERGLANAKKVTPLLMNGEVTKKFEGTPKVDDIIYRYTFTGNLFYRCGKHKETDGTEHVWIFPSLIVEQNEPLPFICGVNGGNEGKVLYSENMFSNVINQKKNDANTLFIFNMICEDIEKKCKQFGLHFAWDLQKS